MRDYNANDATAVLSYIYIYIYIVAIMIIKDSSILTYAAIGGRTKSPTFDPTVSAAPSVTAKPTRSPIAQPECKINLIN